MDLPAILEEKKWVLIFCYTESFEVLKIDDIPDNIAVFRIGSDENMEGIYAIPWLSRSDFWDLIDLSDVSILRGEISSVRGLMSGRPFLWDMYKGIG